jgi:hypothetical protein
VPKLAVAADRELVLNHKLELAMLETVAMPVFFPEPLCAQFDVMVIPGFQIPN